MLELFLVLTKYVLITANRSNYAVTIHYKFPALLTWYLYHTAASMPFTTFGKWGWGWARHLSMKIGRNAAKMRGEMPNLNNSRSF
jgi:hypothetical protein